MAQQVVNQEVGATGDEVMVNGDQLLLYLVGGLLVFFYFVISWILKSAETDKHNRLSALPKKGYGNSKVSQD